MLSTLCPDLPQPAVRVMSDGDSTAGEDFTLQCRVETVEGVRPEDIFIQWTGPDDGLISSGDNRVIGELTTDGAVTTGSLQFSPLHTSDGGQYICTGRVVASSVEVDVRSSASSILRVTSKSHSVLSYICMCYFHFSIIILQSLHHQCQYP